MNKTFSFLFTALLLSGCATTKLIATQTESEMVKSTSTCVKDVEGIKVTTTNCDTATTEQNTQSTSGKTEKEISGSAAIKQEVHITESEVEGIKVISKEYKTVLDKDQTSKPNNTLDTDKQTQTKAKEIGNKAAEIKANNILNGSQANESVNTTKKVPTKIVETQVEGITIISREPQDSNSQNEVQKAPENIGGISIN